MKKFAFAAIAAPLALAACAQEETVAEEEGQEVQDNDVEVVPPVQADTPINETPGATGQGSNLSTDGADIQDPVAGNGSETGTEPEAETE